jgi:hypothetical protein
MFVFAIASVFATGETRAGSAVGTDERPLSLTCENLVKTIRSPSRAEGSPVIAGTMTVVAEDDANVPPALLGCKGDRHIICVMETPSSANPGDVVDIAGRLSQMGENYVMVDPCGVHSN